MKICLFYFIYILNLNRNFYKVLFLTLIKTKKTNYSGGKKENTTCVFVVILKTKLISCRDHASKLGQRICLDLITVHFIEHVCHSRSLTKSTLYSLFDLITTVPIFFKKSNADHSVFRLTYKL
jgi:accessory gene regulator protein AgrB